MPRNKKKKSKLNLACLNKKVSKIPRKAKKSVAGDGEVDMDVSFHPEQGEEEEMLYYGPTLPQEEKKESNGHVEAKVLHVSSKQSLPARKKRKSNQSIPKGYMLVTFDDTISAKELKALVAQNQNIKPPLRGNLRHQLLMPVGCWIDLSAVLSDQHFDSFLEINKQLRFEHLDGHYYIEPVMSTRIGNPTQSCST
jgi:hypothetical protein